MQKKLRLPSDVISINSIGYLPDQQKRAVVRGKGLETGTYYLIDSGGKRIYTGTLTPAPPHPDLDQSLFYADFSPVTENGRYRVEISGTALQSPEFSIGADIYNEPLVTVMKGFYGQRCGVPLSLEHRGIRYEKKACHLEDGFLDYYDPPSQGQKKECTGGWHDAGDYGKYTVNAAFATGLMLSAWEEWGGKLEELALPIPESGGTLPDILAEIKFNLDWMLKMQFEGGEVSHKVTRQHFSPMIMPSEDREKRYFSPWGTDAAASFAAVMSQAGRVYRRFDSAFAEICLAAASRAMNVLKKNQMRIVPDLSKFNTGRYLRVQHSDLEWALLEYWKTTGDQESAKYIGFMFHNENYHVDVDWDWGLSKNLGIYSYLRAGREGDPSLTEEFKKDVVYAADRIVENASRHPYGRGLKRNYWGCNGSIARTVCNLHAAGTITGKEIYRETALQQLSYLYGNNPFGRSFVTGDGFDPPLFPHHRPSAADGIEQPWPGHLVGGPHPAETDWYDVTEDPRTNENAINWDASLMFALSLFYTG